MVFFFTFQLTVFRMLFQQWSDFCQFRESTTEDKIMPTIERHRKRAKIAEKKKQKEIEERKERVGVKGWVGMGFGFYTVS